MGLLTNMSRLEKTLLAGIVAGFFVELAAANAPKTTFDFPERNLRVHYYTETTDKEKNRCGDGVPYRFLVEAQLDNDKPLAAYLDCESKGYLDEWDIYLDHYRCISVQGKNFKNVQHPLCHGFAPLSSINELSFFSNAKSQYKELLGLLGSKQEK